MRKHSSICHLSFALGRHADCVAKVFCVARVFAGMLAISLGLLWSSSAFAQSSKGILAGVVRDKTGAVVSKASVTVTSEDTGETRSLSTTPQGGYRVEAINPGFYEIQVEMAGFATTASFASPIWASTRPCCSIRISI